MRLILFLSVLAMSAPARAQTWAEKCAQIREFPQYAKYSCNEIKELLGEGRIEEQPNELEKEMERDRDEAARRNELELLRSQQQLQQDEIERLRSQMLRR
jgi:hypothetical protein